jgi:hypothetical protein
MNFHLTHLVVEQPLYGAGPMHGMNGYKEVIDTVQWGLQQLGHSVDYGLNAVSPTAANILFGAQILSMQLLDDLPPETIVFNLEQLRGVAVADVKPQLAFAAKRFRIWEYSAANLDVWAELGAKDVRLVPVGFAPVLQRIAKPPEQDIDVLFYGLTGQNRLAGFHDIVQSGLTSLFVCGLYGKRRDELIARAKVIVNIGNYDRTNIFEIVRVSYLLANRKAVVVVIDADTVIDDDIRMAVRTTSMSELVADCKRLIGDDAARVTLEDAGFAAMERRDIRIAVRAALADPSLRG